MWAKPLQLLVCNSLITETMAVWQDCRAFDYQDNGHYLRVSLERRNKTQQEIKTLAFLIISDVYTLGTIHNGTISDLEVQKSLELDQDLLKLIFGSLLSPTKLVNNQIKCCQNQDSFVMGLLNKLPYMAAYTMHLFT